MQKSIRKNKITIAVASIILFLVLSTLFLLITNRSSLFSHGVNRIDYKLSPEREANYDKMIISYGSIAERKTGTERFDTPDGKTVEDGSLVSDMDGHDVSIHDDYIRTFDSITYILELGIDRNQATTEPGVLLNGGIIKVKVTIPKDETGLTYLTIGRDEWMKGYSYNSDRTELTCYYEIPQEKHAVGGIQELSFTVFSSGFKKQLSANYTPKFEVWMEGNKNDNPDSTAESLHINDTNLNITASSNPDWFFNTNSSAVNAKSELNGVEGNYISFAAGIRGNGSATKGSFVPLGPVSGKFRIEYQYKDLNSGSNNWVTIDENDPLATDIINGTTLVAYGRPCEPTPGFWPTENSNKNYSYCASGNSTVSDGTIYQWNSGTMTASQNGNEILFQNVDNTFVGSYSSATMIANGFELFVPFYNSENGSYDYRIKLISEELTYYDNLGNLHTAYPNRESTIPLRKEVTGNYSISTSAYGSSSYDTAGIAPNERREFYSDVSTQDGIFNGGLERLLTFDATAVDLEAYSNLYDVYVHYSSGSVYSSPSNENVTIKYGVYKSNPTKGLTNANLVNTATYEDFDWYDSINEANEHGVTTAFFTIEPDYIGKSITSYCDFYFRAKTDPELNNYIGIMKTTITFYLDANKTQGYTFGQNQTYEQLHYNPTTGNIVEGTPSGIGHTYMISSYSLGISSVFTKTFDGREKTNYNIQEGTIDLKITPKIIKSEISETNPTSSFRVKARIPSELYFLANSANYEPVSVTNESNGETIVTWIFENWDTAVPLPAITFSVEISPYINNNASKYFHFYLYDNENEFIPYAYVQKNVTITNLAGASLRKDMTRGFVDRDGGFQITDHVYNISQMELRDVKTFEILPKNNDENGSSYSGTAFYTLDSLAPNQRFFYTTVNPNSINYTYDDAGNKTIKDVDLGADSRFIEIGVGGTIPTNATMIATYIPVITTMDDVEFKYTAHLSGNYGGDKYYYQMNASSSSLDGALKTEPIAVTVTERKISGLAFADTNRNDIFDEGDSLLPNINVQLIEVANGTNAETVVDQTTTNASGEYIFSLDHAGKYKVQFTNLSGYEIVAKGNANAPDTSKANSNGKTDLINHDDNPYQAIMEKGNYNFGIRKKVATLTTKYLIYGSNANLFDPVVETVYYTDTYTTSPPSGTIPAKYVFKNNAGDPTTGTVNKDNIEVIYYYTLRDATLTVKYVDEDDVDIDPTQNIINQAKHWDDEYTTTQKTFTNYNFVEQTGDPASGIIAKDHVEVIYHYALKPATLTIKYVDQNGDDIDPSQNIINAQRHWGDSYTSTQKTFAYYNFVSRTGDPASGTITKDHVEVVYHYELKPATLTIKYVDQNDNYIDPTKNTINAPKHYGDTYTSEQLTFTNYNFVNRTGDQPNGIIAKDHVEVVYHYAIKDATLTVKYVDQNGNDIDPTKNTINAPRHWGDTYTSSQLTFTNYNFVERTGDPASGTITKDHVEVIYHYALKDATLTIKYVDQNGNDIDPTQNTINAPKHWGDVYTSTQKTFAYYNYVNQTGDAPSGIITKDHVEVIYHYELKEATLTIKYVDEYGSDIDPTKNTINAPKHYGDTYTSSQLTFTNYNFINRTGDQPNGVINKDHVEVIYHYQVKSADVTARYIDEDGNNIISPITINSYWGNTYTTEQKTFTNYSFVRVAANSDPVSGTIGKDHIVVTYIYHLKEATLTIKYVDENGDDIDPSKNTINAPRHWGDSYTSSQLTFTNYTFFNRTGDIPNGIIDKDHIEIIYHYVLKEATLTVKYVDQNNQDIDPTKNIIEAPKHWGEAYSTQQLTFTNYRFVEQTGDPASGTVTKDTIEVIYHYALKDATLTIKYVDENGDDIDPTKNTINAPKHWGDSYSSQDLVFTNYRFVNRTGDPASGTIAKDHVEVIYHYALKDATLTIKYVDQDGNDIDPTKNTINAPKHWGDSYTSEQLSFTNYTFANRTGDPASGTIAKDHVEVIYHYTIKDATLTIKYVDQDGHDIDPTKNTINAPKHWGDTYTSEQLTFTNYNFDERTGDAPSGTIAKDHVEVIYHYTIKDATLTIKYVDQDGNDIDPTKNTINAPKHWGDTYTSTQLTFTNYNFVERTGDPASGTIAKDHVEVIYHYVLKEATLTIKYVDQDGNDIDPTKNTINAPKHWGDTYTSEQLVFTNYNFDERTGDAPSGTISKDHVEVIYHYIIKDATLTIKYVDEDGHDIDPTLNTINAPKHWGDTYSSEQLVFTNYSFVERQGDAPSGTIAKDHVEVTYVYHLKEASLTVRYVDETGNNIQPIFTKDYHWGDSYTTEQKVIPNYAFVKVSDDSDPTSGIVGQNAIHVTYIYHLKEATLTIKYVDEQGHDIDPTKNVIEEPKHWGDSYTSEQLTFPNYNFVERRGDAASGIIEKDNVVVTYVYTLKPSTITVHHYIEGTEEKIAPDEVIPRRYTDSYSTHQIDTTNLDYEFANRTGDEPSGIVNKDSYEITYNYKLKRGTIYTHHYLYENGVETTTELAPDDVQTLNYTESYNTSESPDVPKNYELYRKTDNYTDVLRSPRVDVYYYYQLKDSQLSTTIEKTGTDKITSKKDEVNYTIKWNAEIKDYIDSGQLTIIDYLPYAIDVDQSNIAGGTYNPDENTITWVENWDEINSFTADDETAKLEVIKEVRLLFTNIDSKERLMINRVSSELVLSNNSRSIEATKETILNIPGTITVKYIDENEKVIEQQEYTDLVGEPLITEAIEKDGYNLVEKPDVEEYEFEDEPRVVIYKYERIMFNIKTIVNGEGGEITGNEMVPWGEDSTKNNIVAKAKKGYAIDKVIVDGKEIKIPKNKTELTLDNFIDVKEDHLVEVTFIIYNPNTSTKYIIIAAIISIISVLIIIYSKRGIIFTTKKAIS